MYDLELFNEIDEIDHFTLAVRKGRPFDRKAAIALIRRYAARYPYVAALDARFDAVGETFGSFDDQALYESLIRMRDEMAGHVGIRGFCVTRNPD